MNVTFKIEYHTKWGESLTLDLGGKKFPMQWTDGNVWTVTVDNLTNSDLDSYSYQIIEDGLITRLEWDNHHAKLNGRAKNHILTDKWIDSPIPGCPFPRKHNAAKFDITGFRGAGTVIPVFSLRGADDFGIGEFRDLRALVDWAASTGQCIIQLLPINDTTRRGEWKDSYPYSPISSFALHPLYIHLQDLGIKETDSFKQAQKELNSLPSVDYPRVFKEKSALIKKAYTATGAKDLSSRAFASFYKDNAFWLEEYSQFCAQRDGDEKEYHQWIQFHLDKQLGEEVAYARSKGVSFKGDLPIGVSADSADAHFHPELFNLDSCAGAPPDYFSRDGQNWGFPTYNWDAMAKDHFAWWKSRLKKMGQYFDAFRIDHVLGFFRIWEIPSAYKSGMMGHFNPALPYKPEEISAAGLPIEGLFLPDPRNQGCYQPMISPDTTHLDNSQKDRFYSLYNDFFYHRHNEFWRRNAERKLPELLSASGMLACAEDLGMIPDCVPGVMDHWKILSLEMAQMNKGRDWPYLSVCATSSHDMSTLRLQNKESGKGDMKGWEAKRILKGHLDAQSMLAIFPIQDWLAIDETIRREDFENERINDPSNPDNHWCYRLHLNVEDLSKDKAHELRVQIEGLIKDSGRYYKQ